jgi:hypothetical protein
MRLHVADTDPILPATDEEIEALEAACLSRGRVLIAREAIALIARIESDRRVITDQAEEIKRLREAIMPEHDLGISSEACCGREISHYAAMRIAAKELSDET